eukprot:TRINITY_DN4994_c0_g1_i1.p1 TRINITY_DN4994_c0_g1~~TRINITY_DN4994_c0_g1_i1.p1  ORF type:complete len:117 (-),score=13.69 TRINITY_DN4994_c0_g1_i1:768-1118(-)
MWCVCTDSPEHLPAANFIALEDVLEGDVSHLADANVDVSVPVVPFALVFRIASLEVKFLTELVEHRTLLMRWVSLTARKNHAGGLHTVQECKRHLNFAQPCAAGGQIASYWILERF